MHTPKHNAFEGTYIVRSVIDHIVDKGWILNKIDVFDSLYGVNAKKMSDTDTQLLNKVTTTPSSNISLEMTISELMPFVKSTFDNNVKGRSIVIPKDLAVYIRQQGYIYKGSPQSISNYMKRAQKELKLPSFSLHKTRHYFASRMLDEGYDMKTIEEWGGWAGSETLSKIYQHSLKMKQDEAKQKIADIFSVE